MKKHQQKEKDQLLFDLEHYTNSFLLNSHHDNIWDQIITNINNYNELMHQVPFLDNTPECPLIQSERPDVIYSTKNTDFVMGIECFKFDSSPKTSKGSTQIRKELKIKKQIATDLKNGYLTDGDGKTFSSVRKKVDVEFSVHDYYMSLIYSFLSHAKNIQDYRNNLRSLHPQKKIYLSFFIEDITALGNLVEDNGKIESMTPLKLPLFVKYLAATSGLDYVLIKTKNMYVPNIDIQSCDNENIKTMLAGCYSTKTKFVTYQYSIEQHIYHT